MLIVGKSPCRFTMADSVQYALDRMVADLEDLRQRGIFSKVNLRCSVFLSGLVWDVQQIDRFVNLLTEVIVGASSLKYERG